MVGKDSDTPSTSSSAAAGHSQQVANAAALSRARAENVHLRRKLGIAPTGLLVGKAVTWVSKQYFYAAP
eukprot:6236407-Amphidinium_carterae.1